MRVFQTFLFFALLIVLVHSKAALYGVGNQNFVEVDYTTGETTVLHAEPTLNPATSTVDASTNSFVFVTLGNDIVTYTQGNNGNVTRTASKVQTGGQSIQIFNIFYVSSLQVICYLARIAQGPMVIGTLDPVSGNITLDYKFDQSITPGRLVATYDAQTETLFAELTQSGMILATVKLSPKIQMVSQCDLGGTFLDSLAVGASGTMFALWEAGAWMTSFGTIDPKSCQVQGMSSVSGSHWADSAVIDVVNNVLISQQVTQAGFSTGSIELAVIALADGTVTSNATVDVRYGVKVMNFW